MNKPGFYEKIEEVLKDSSEDACKEAIEEVETLMETTEEEDVQNQLTYLFKRLNVHLLEIKRDSLNEDQYKEKIHLNGKIARQYKKISKHAPTHSEQLSMRHEHLECLKKQKELLKNYQEEEKEIISIPEKIALKIKEISKTTEIFLKEKDVFTKFKNTIKQTVVGAGTAIALIAGVSFAIQKFTHLPIGMFSLASVMPIIAYIGLTSFIRNFSSKTEYQQYEYQQSDEYKELVEQFNKDHEEEIKTIAKLIKEKQEKEDPDDIISINERLIEQIDLLAKNCKIDGVRQAFELQAYGYYLESRACCEKIKDDYLDEVYDDKERYKDNNKRLARINLQIFKRGNSLKESVIHAGKSIAKGTAVMVAAKAILALIAPGMFAIHGIQSFIEPFIFLVISGVIDIPTYAGKLKYRETEYEGRVKVNELERLQKLLEIKKKEMGMGNNQKSPAYA